MNVFTKMDAYYKNKYYVCLTNNKNKAFVFLYIASSSFKWKITKIAHKF